MSQKVVVCDGFSSMIIRVKKLFDFFLIINTPREGQWGQRGRKIESGED